MADHVHVFEFRDIRLRAFVCACGAQLPDSAVQSQESEFIAGLRGEIAQLQLTIDALKDEG